MAVLSSPEVPALCCRSDMMFEVFKAAEMKEATIKYCSFQCAKEGGGDIAHEGCRAWERTPLPSAFDDNVECKALVYSLLMVEQTGMIYSVMVNRRGLWVAGC